MDLRKMTAKKLESEYDNEGEHSSFLNRQLIELGLGDKTNSDLRKMEPRPFEVQRYLDSLDRFSDILTEVNRRQNYHGSLKPIKE